MIIILYEWCVLIPVSIREMVTEVLEAEGSMEGPPAENNTEVPPITDNAEEETKKQADHR